ncbi:cytochrome c biogenesis protein ResB [Synechococcus sp. CCY9201]|uniref:cytochrome c biogenesis protein ResB n=1 Tax=unclassified Synechococcus TaxID=2626047 RepID=UPI0018CCFCB1|nr:MULTISPECIES: cytochrome c biogenesis protein ResB [unclassified Synechococcus]MEA5423815.1 cytochrome c biogenesis protein ResB [Synechococcus sp. CCY9202]MEA5473921.1 cytochrome c biogenesis protein ResB [Synechococcus sp. CCY9201]QPN66918.1 cytochrome c biogenesis protein ResB [Synechococcus sp. CBW1006]CAK6691200.1 Cytochrome c biogenesis protein CcsB [Synechococcus sp. CBW1107]
MTSSSATSSGPTRTLQRLIAALADLRLAIALLVVIAIASGIGTAIPQQESAELYHRIYDNQPWLGLLDGDGVLRLQLDHVYSSSWFLALLAWLGLALLLCSWRRQWPALQAALRWIDYRSPRQLSKLSLAETVSLAQPQQGLDRLADLLAQQGWQLQRHPDRLAARKGILGRIGPLLVHAGMVVLMVGAAWGSLGGHRQEQFLAPGRELELLDSRGRSQLTLALDRFAIERDPAGRPEQFRSQLRLLNPADPTTGEPSVKKAEISVNHPLRYRGITLYQADWALAAITVQLGRSPLLQLPLQSFPQLGEQIWGLVLPTRPDGSEPVLLSLSSEDGPVQVFGPDGQSLAQLVPGGPAQEVKGLPVRVVSVLPASGILLKRDPGVPLVYTGFAIALAGGAASLIATRQLWAIAESSESADSIESSNGLSSDRPGRLHVAGLCNRNLTAFSQELPSLLAQLDLERSTGAQQA